LGEALSKAFTAWALGEGTLASAVSRSRDCIGQDDYAYKGEYKTDYTDDGDLCD
jgi:hypothetical protein